MRVQSRVAWGLGAMVLMAGACGAGGLPPLVQERVLNVPSEKVWEVFSTAEGFKKMGPAQVDMDFRIGGKIRSKYSKDGTLGDEGTIEQEILAFDPGRMLTFRCVKTPKGFQNSEAFLKTWTVVTVEDLGDSRTRLTLKGLGYGDDEASKAVWDFFKSGNEWVMQKLASNLEGTPMPTRNAHDGAAAAKEEAAKPKAAVLSKADSDGPIEIEAIVGASPLEAWKMFSTSEGWKAMFGVESKIECAIGGPFEIYFSMTPPEGQRGSEGCKVLSFEPGRMLSYSWNAPPKFENARGKHTWVVVTFEPETAGRTRVRLSHQGFQDWIAKDSGHAAEWKDVRAYFTNAWPHVLTAMVEHFEPTTKSAK